MPQFLKAMAFISTSIARHLSMKNTSSSNANWRKSLTQCILFRNEQVTTKEEVSKSVNAISAMSVPRIRKVSSQRVV